MLKSKPRRHVEYSNCDAQSLCARRAACRYQRSPAEFDDSLDLFTLLFPLIVTRSARLSSNQEPRLKLGPCVDRWTVNRCECSPAFATCESKGRVASSGRP